MQAQVLPTFWRDAFVLAVCSKNVSKNNNNNGTNNNLRSRKVTKEFPSFHLKPEWKV